VRIRNSKPSGPVIMIDQSEIGSCNRFKFIIVFSTSVRLYSGFSQHQKSMQKCLAKIILLSNRYSPSVSLLGQNPDRVWLGFEIPQAISFVFFFCTTISCFLRCVIIDDRRLGCFFSLHFLHLDFTWCPHSTRFTFHLVNI
jgi:hypothetical protein